VTGSHAQGIRQFNMHDAVYPRDFLRKLKCNVSFRLNCILDCKFDDGRNLYSSVDAKIIVENLGGSGVGKSCMRRDVLSQM
jgi:hypothetical protein